MLPMRLQIKPKHTRIQNVTDSNNPIIADLQWALYSPNLPVPKAVQSRVWPRPAPLWLNRHDQHHITSTLIKPRHQRLGRYFESLWAAGLTAHPDWLIALSGYPIRSAQRTLGEIDLVVLQQNTQQLTHLELALKFYLRVDHPNCGHQHHWLGPTLADSYEQKLKRLLEHQLPMGLHPEVEAALPGPVSHQGLVIKGRLFVPAETYTPDEKAQGYGIWLTMNALAQYAQTEACLPLARSQWLTGPAHACWQSTERLLNSMQAMPMMIWLRKNAQTEPQWAMVVPNDWAKKAACCCPQTELEL